MGLAPGHISGDIQLQPEQWGMSEAQYWQMQVDAGTDAHDAGLESTQQGAFQHSNACKIVVTVRLLQSYGVCLCLPCCTKALHHHHKGMQATNLLKNIS